MAQEYQNNNFFSPSPDHIGAIDINLPDIRSAIENICNSVGPCTKQDLRFYFPYHAKMHFMWNDKMNLVNATGGEPSTENDVAVLFEHYIDFVKKSGFKPQKSEFIADWTVYTSVFDEWHIDPAPFIFCPLTSLPIESYRGQFQQMESLKRLEIKIDNDITVLRSKYGQILHFPQNAVHRRGLLNSGLKIPQLRMRFRSSRLEN